MQDRKDCLKFRKAVFLVISYLYFLCVCDSRYGILSEQSTLRAVFLFASLCSDAILPPVIHSRIFPSTRAIGACNIINWQSLM